MEFSPSCPQACPFDSPGGSQPRSRWEQIDKLRGKGRKSRGNKRPGINVEVTEETQDGVSWRE